MFSYQYIETKITLLDALGLASVAGFKQAFGLVGWRYPGMPLL
jgi:hypothetical protein